MESQSATSCVPGDSLKEAYVEGSDCVSQVSIPSEVEKNHFSSEVSESGDHLNSADNIHVFKDENVNVPSETIRTQSVDPIDVEAPSCEVHNTNTVCSNTAILPTPSGITNEPHVHDNIVNFSNPQNISSDPGQCNTNVTSRVEEQLSSELPEENKADQPEYNTKEPATCVGSSGINSSGLESCPESAKYDVHDHTISSEVAMTAGSGSDIVQPDSSSLLSQQTEQDNVRDAEIVLHENFQRENIVQSSTPPKDRPIVNNEIPTAVADSSLDDPDLLASQDLKSIKSSTSAKPIKSLDQFVEDSRQALEHINLDKSNDPSESGSTLSVPDSMNDTFDQQAARYVDSDEDILPGARRPRHSQSDEEDEDDDEISGDYNSEYDDEDEDLVDSELAPDVVNRYSDVEDSQTNEPGKGEDRVSSPCESESLGTPCSPENLELAGSPSSNKQVQLDADQDKSNPAYIPRTGRYFMHDCREAEDEEITEPVNEVQSRKDTRRWQHDRFRYRDQAPRSREELIRKYGYDIRNEHTDKGVSSVTPELAPQNSSEPLDNSNPTDVSSVVDNSDTEHRHSSDGRHQPSSFARGVGSNRGRIRGAHRSVHQSSQPRSPDDVNVPPPRSLRGRFTVGQGRPFYPASRGRSDASHIGQVHRSEGEGNFERRAQSGLSAGRAHNQDMRKHNRERPDYRNTDSHYVPGRRSRYMKNPNDPTEVSIQQDRVTNAKSFTRYRGAPPKDNTDFSAGKSVPNNIQPRRQGPNQIVENVIPRTRDVHKPLDPGPKRYSALRQTTGYQPTHMEDRNHPRPNAGPTHQESQHTIRNYEVEIGKELRAYSSNKTQFNPITDGFVNPSSFVTSSMTLMDHTGPTYALDVATQPRMYNQGSSDESAAFSRTHHSNLSHMVPVDMYPTPNVHTFPEEVSIPPYAYQQPVDAYQFAPSGTYQQYDSFENRERRPVLGRRPLKPLEIKDPRERVQSRTAADTDQNRAGKRGPAQESWSKPVPDLAPQST